MAREDSSGYYPIPSRIRYEDQKFAKRHIRDSWDYSSTSASLSDWRSEQSFRPTVRIPLANVGRHIFPHSSTSGSMEHHQQAKGVGTHTIMRTNFLAINDSVPVNKEKTGQASSNDFFFFNTLRAEGDNETTRNPFSMDPRRKKTDITPFGDNVFQGYSTPTKTVMPTKGYFTYSLSRPDTVNSINETIKTVRDFNVKVQPNQHCYSVRKTPWGEQAASRNQGSGFSIYRAVSND